MWLANRLKEEIVLEAGPSEVTMDLCWAYGMIGALPVFTTKQEAVDYAGSEDFVVELQEKPCQVT